MPVASVESLTADTATLIVFINQTVTQGSEAPTGTASSVRERLREVDGAWLIEASSHCDTVSLLRIGLSAKVVRHRFAAEALAHK